MLKYETVNAKMHCIYTGWPEAADTKNDKKNKQTGASIIKMLINKLEKKCI